MQRQKISEKLFRSENMELKNWRDKIKEMEKETKEEEIENANINVENEEVEIKKEKSLLDDILIKFSQLQRARDFYYDDIETKVLIGEETDNPLELETPFYFNVPYFPSKNIQRTFILAAGRMKTFVNIGDLIGTDEIKFAGENNCKFAVEWNSARLINLESLQRADAVVIRIGYKNEIISAEKITKEIAEILKIKEGEDFIYPSRHFDIESGDDLKKHVELLRNLTDYRVPIIVKIGIADVYEDIVNAINSKADAIEIYGKNDFHIGIFSSLQRALRENKTNAKILFSGFVENSSDAFKCLCLGGNAIGLSPKIEENLDFNDLAELLNAELLEYAEGVKKLTAMTGHKTIEELSNEDLRAKNYNSASITGLKLIGYDRQLPMWEHL